MAIQNALKVIDVVSLNQNFYRQNWHHKNPEHSSTYQTQNHDQKWAASFSMLPSNNLGINKILDYAILNTKIISCNHIIEEYGAYIIRFYHLNYRSF